MSYVRRNGEAYWRLLPKQWHVGTWTYQSLFSEPTAEPTPPLAAPWASVPGKVACRAGFLGIHGQPMLEYIGISQYTKEQLPFDGNFWKYWSQFSKLGFGITTFQNRNRTNNCELSFAVVFQGSLGRSFQGLGSRRHGEASVWVEALLAGLSGASFKHFFHLMSKDSQTGSW